MFAVALFMPAATGENPEMKFSADLAHFLAFPMGWLSASLVGKGRKLAAIMKEWK